MSVVDTEVSETSTNLQQRFDKLCPRPVSCVINVASVVWFSVCDGRQVYMYNVVFNNIAVILGDTLYRW